MFADLAQLIDVALQLDRVDRKGVGGREAGVSASHAGHRRAGLPSIRGGSPGLKLTNWFDVCPRVDVRAHAESGRLGCRRGRASRSLPVPPARPTRPSCDNGAVRRSAESRARAGRPAQPTTNTPYG